MLSQSVPFPGLSSLGPGVAAPQRSQGISSGLQPGSCKLLKDSHERGLSWINCPGSSNLVSATLFSTPLLGCSQLFLQAGAVGRICATHRVADLALLVLRLTGQIHAANPLLPGVGPPLVCWVDQRFNHMPWEEDSIQSFSAGGRSGIVLPENMVTKLDVKGGKWGSDCV